MSSASQEIPLILWNPNFHYHIHMYPPPVPFLSHSNLVHTSPCHSLKIHFNITLSSMLTSSKWSIPIRSPYLRPACTSSASYTCHLPAHIDKSEYKTKKKNVDPDFNPYPTAFPYGNGMVLHFYQQQESSTTKTVHKIINRGLKAYV